LLLLMFLRSIFFPPFTKVTVASVWVGLFDRMWSDRNFDQTTFIKARSRCIVVREEGTHPRGCGFKSCRILDGCKRC
jgi:hypothetical protein